MNKEYKCSTCENYLSDVKSNTYAEEQEVERTRLQKEAKKRGKKCLVCLEFRAMGDSDNGYFDNPELCVYCHDDCISNAKLYSGPLSDIKWASKRAREFERARNKR